jgi:hypothetical protein
MLTGVQWKILCALDDDALAPLEEIALGLRGEGYALSADDLLSHILALFEGSFVLIMQEPIPSFGQTFRARVIEPVSPRDVLGDVAGGFEDFCASGDYGRREKSCARTKPAGVPFGIYLVLTEAGRRERDDSTYECYRGQG